MAKTNVSVLLWQLYDDLPSMKMKSFFVFMLAREECEVTEV